MTKNPDGIMSPDDSGPVDDIDISKLKIVDCAVISVFETSSGASGHMRIRGTHRKFEQKDLTRAAEALIDARQFSGVVVVRAMAGMSEADSQELYDSLEGDRCTPGAAQKLCNAFEKDGKGTVRNMRAEDEMRKHQGPGWKN